jgi:hypothetical protein
VERRGRSVTPISHRLPPARAALLIGAAAVIWAGCTETTGPDEPFSLEFRPLPAPFIVAGDTLRDIDGNAVPLQAIVYNLQGVPLDDAEVAFVALDSTGSLQIDQATGYVVAAGTKRGTARLLASTATIQSAPIALRIIPQPARVAQSGTIDTLLYSASNPALNTSSALRVRVSRDSADAPVPLYFVRFRLEDIADTVFAKFVDDTPRQLPLDPTGASSITLTGEDGIASRRIRITPSQLLNPAMDSVVVFADVRLRGNDVTGSPVRLVLPVKLRPVS